MKIPMPRLVTWDTIKLGIMIPWGLDMIWRRTWETYEKLEKPPQYKLFFGTGRTPARRHEIGCEECLKWGASHILILGGDQTYPEQNMIRQMLKWMEVNNLDEWILRKKVINCLVPIRGHRPGQNTRPFQPIGQRLDPETAEPVQVTRDDPPLVKAYVVGTGVMLFEAEVLRDMSKPWFADHHHKETNSVDRMQDVEFVNKLNEMGCQVWLDTQIVVKHLTVLEADDTFQRRFD